MYEVRARTSFTCALALARVFASGSEGEPSQISTGNAKKKYCLPLRQYVVPRASGRLTVAIALRQDGAYLHYPGRRAPPDPGRRNMRVMQAALVAAVAAVPTVEIAPGVHMPMISLGAGHTRGTPLPTPCLTAQRPLHPHGVPIRYLAVQLVARRECGEPRAQAWLHAHRHRQRLQEPRRRRPRTGASHNRSRSDGRNATPCPCTCPEPSPNPTPDAALTPSRRAAPATPTF